MSDFLTVGDVAKRAGTTPKTVRYYEEIGLLPQIRRGANGYRYFRLDELNRLLFVQRAKNLGLSLREIQELVSVAEGGRCGLTRAELGQILADKIADCTQRIEWLAAFRDQLEAAAQQLDVTADEPGEACCSGCAAFNPACDCIPELPNESI